MSNFKWTDEKIQNYISSNANGYVLLRIERGVKGGKTRLFLQCEKNHEYDVNFDNFQKGKRCPHCAGNVKLTYEKVKRFIEIESKSNCILLDEGYKDIDSKLLIKCNCENNFKTTFYHFKYSNKRSCNNCSHRELSERNRNSIDYVSEQIFRLSNGNVRLLSKEYINGKTPIELGCSCGSNFKVKYNDFLSNKQYQCQECGLKKRVDSRRFTFEEVKNDIENNGYRLMTDDYIASDTPLPLECQNGHESNIIYNNFRRGARCQQCYFESMGGENHHSWKGGVTPLHEYLRSRITEWKNRSKETSNYKCVISGEKFDVIHHLYPFHKIMNETLSELDIPILPAISDYTESELQKIAEKCLEIHYRYPNGVCLTNEIHYLFHSLYGKHNNTQEQFYEFTERYKDGEFNKLLEEVV